jgi:sugar/nucleoside kinase (ribokinase family)
MVPDILILGQITVDDTAPSEPGPWHRRLGGNALYSVAGARLWCSPDRIGMVARVPGKLPFDVPSVLRQSGISTLGLKMCEEEALIEWILYEEDGNRQSLPRNPALRDPAADIQTLYARYLTHLGNISATAEDIPSEWLPAKAIHLAPQIIERHRQSSATLAERTEFLSVDPSPHYSRSLSAREIRMLLPGVTAFLPSQAEVQHLGMISDWREVAKQLANGGFAEVVLKRGRDGCILAENRQSKVETVRTAKSAPVDLTGAGDAFSGAYAACRGLGFSPQEAAIRAVVTSAMVIECSGTEAALRLDPIEAQARLREYQLPAM